MGRSTSDLGRLGPSCLRKHVFAKMVFETGTTPNGRSGRTRDRRRKVNEGEKAMRKDVDPEKASAGARAHF
eukprot:3089557-Pyramimonas_sp.AAC.1